MKKLGIITLVTVVAVASACSKSDGPAKQQVDQAGNVLVQTTAPVAGCNCICAPKTTAAAAPTKATDGGTNATQSNIHTPSGIIVEMDESGA